MKQKSAPRPASLDARKIRRAYAPYRWEGRNFRLMVLILCIVLLLLWLWCETTEPASRNIAYLLMLMAMLASIAIGKSCVAIFSRYEERKQRFVEQSVRIQQVILPNSVRGAFMSCEGAPELAHVMSCCVIAVTLDGQKLRLLSACGDKRREALMRVMARSEQSPVTVIYGQYSRVIVGFRGAGYDGVDFERMV